MFEKIKKILGAPFITQFRDIRAVGFAVFGILVLLVSWSSVKVIETNYKLERQIAKLEQQNQLLGLENTNQKLRNQYFNTDEYLELQARKQFGKGLPGETLLLVPKDVALSYTVAPPAAQPANPNTPKAEPPLYQRNLVAWRNFLFRNPSAEDN